MGNPEYIEEEINLREMIEVVLKRKMIVLGIFFIVVISTVIATLLMPKTYEVKALIQRGYVNSPVLSYPETVVLLKSRDFLKPIFDKLNIEFFEEESKNMILVENVKDTNFFIIKVRLENNDLGYSLIQEITNKYLEYGNTIYYTQVNLIKNYINQIENLTEKTQTNLEKSQKSSLEQRNISFPMAIPDDKVQIRDLFSQKFQLESQLTTAKEFKLVDVPIKSKYPIFPRKRLIVITSCIIALMIGVFCTLFVESWEKTKSKN